MQVRKLVLLSGLLAAAFLKEPQRYANQNLGISQPNTDGHRPAAYR
jgi:hypothetical protein